MTRTLTVSERAEQDLREIWIYTFENWSEQQADLYLDRLGDTMRACAAHPSRGESRDDVLPGYWSRLAQRHVVYYTFTEDQVLVQRVLHGAMDPTRHAGEDAGQGA